MSTYEYEETSNEEFDLKQMSNILDAANLFILGTYATKVRNNHCFRVSNCFTHLIADTSFAFSSNIFENIA